MASEAICPDSTVGRTGFSTIVSPDNPALDIVFIHGFRGHPERTWTSGGKTPRQKQSEGASDGSEPQPKRRRLLTFQSARHSDCEPVYWPRDLLPSTVPNARVLTFGYDSDIKHRVFDQANRTTVRDIAHNCLVALESERREAPERHLLFVVHSLGGIIVKELLRQSSGHYQRQSHLRKVFESTTGIIFFGTPHDGADPLGSLRHVIERLAKMSGFQYNESIANTLLPSSERLMELWEEFGPLAQERNWLIHSFREGLGVGALNGKKVVEDDSSFLRLPPAIETTEHIGRNHMEMCRFAGPDDVEYKKVDAALRRMTANLSLNLPGGSMPGITPEQRQQLKESLKFDQIDARHRSIKRAHAKTCKWFIKQPKYSDWLDVDKFPDHRGFLWVKGKPGAGKSTLMKYALSHSCKVLKGTTIINFFFNARGDELEKSTTGMYRSLLFQLIDRVPRLDAIFNSLRLTACRWDRPMQWSIESLQDLFEQAVQSLGQSRVVCYIDALDECDEDEIRKMLSLFERVGELAASSGIQFQVCFSSRHYPHITISQGLELALEDQEGHGQDITSYIDSELKIGQSKVAREIKAELQEKASGVFMWVILVVDILNKAFDRGRVHALRKRLREIPASLHELFRDILARDGGDKNELMLCIQWVLFAKRPLKPEELYFAVLAGTDLESVDAWDHELMTMDTIRRFVLDSSKGLAEITKSKAPTVQFIHESVRDFLLKDNGLHEIWSDLGPQFQAQSHCRLKECCMEYMLIAAKEISLPEPLPKARSEEAIRLLNESQALWPFLEYSVHSVLHHADLAESGGVSQAQFLRDFEFPNWIVLNNLFEKFQIRRHELNTSPAYILADGNLAHLLKICTYECAGTDISRGRIASPFLEAVARNNIGALRALVELEFRKNEITATSALDAYQDVLTSRNRIPELRTDMGYYTWRALARHGHSKLIQLLVDVGALEIENTLSSLLEIAISDCEVDLVDVFLATGRRHVLPRAGLEQVPHRLAAFYGHTPAINVLLGIGEETNVNEGDNIGLSPLDRAALLGHADVARALIATGRVTINAQYPNPEDALPVVCGMRSFEGFTALHFAVLLGRTAVVDVLLEAGGADVNLKAKNGWTPLSLAARKGHTNIAWILLGIDGIDVNAPDQDGFTPLSWAASCGHFAMVQMLSGITGT
ncbi:Uncharacterized protein SAPIO_CDS7594 [Scedosporium apiospermum]|uniref:Nephrocystin 3-like N-terminal domain-containing protein n=1 Tax=Pseudallescheria apiosperma TaxID=563466 RepID=A0A084G294_PSEDA|nr:Uncharacterized protein SAPIO_CDS7594 [Scedosporium apiospermum]KEZ41456.1 Uncharacterized protein SAPIO_CDS7594 [Scedosporium apiospermum]